MRDIYGNLTKIPSKQIFRTTFTPQGDNFRTCRVILYHF